MKIVLKKMVVNTVLLLTVVFISNAQTTNNQEGKNTAGKLGSLNPIVEIDLPDSTKPVHHSSEYILNFFLSEARKTKYLSINDERKPSIVICTIDSLQFIVESLLDSFIFRNTGESLGYGDYSKINNITLLHNSLTSQFFRPKMERNSFLLADIKKSIDSLQPSKEKIDLLLQYAEFSIPNNESYYSELAKVYQSTQTIAHLIQNKVETAKALTYIGDFAIRFSDNYFALKFYFAARMLFRLAHISSGTKDTEDGKLCKKISDVFNNASYLQNDLRISEKISKYLELAKSDFSSKENTKLYVEAWVYKFLNDSYILSHFLFSDTTVYTKELLSKNFNSLYFWYYYHTRGHYSYNINYLGLASIGKILLWQNNYKESLIFYLRALPFALSSNNTGYVDGCLSGIMYAFDQLKENDKTDFYRDLRHSFNSYYWGDWAKCDYLITKAEYFYYSNKDDSALLYLDRFLFDTSYKENLSPPNYISFDKKAVGLKFPILYSLNKDSASIYENYFHNYNESDARNIVSLFEAESESNQLLTEVEIYNKDSVNNLIKDSLKFETDRLTEVNSSLNETILERTSLITELNNKALKLSGTNLVLFNKISYAEKSIKTLNSQNYQLKGNNQKLTDSITRNNSILALTTKKNSDLDIINDSLARINSNLTQKTLDLKKEIASWTSGAILIFILGLIVSAILGTRIYNRVKKIKALNLESYGLKSQMEANRIATENELKYSYEKNLKELTIKHEIVGLISELYAGYTNRFLTPGTKTDDTNSKLIEFGDRFKNLESFSRHYYKLLRDDRFNRIDDEVELCKRYVEVAKINKGEIIFDDLRTIKRADIVLPHHCLNSFTKNSIEKGKINDETLTITIEDRQDIENYTLIISDNGKGLPNDFNLSNLPDESTGLRNVLSQIKYFNSRNEIPYTIEFNKDSIANRIADNNISGVAITLIFKPKK